MIQKKNISMSIYFLLLPPIMLLSYYVSGIFTFPDISIYNAADYLEKVFLQFYRPWLWANEKTPACMGVGLIVWVFLCWYLSYHMRNFQFGLEYGAEDWGDAEEITARREKASGITKKSKKLQDKGLPDSNHGEFVRERILTRNLRIPLSGDGAPSNNNMLVIGSSGTYKTTSIVTPNILLAQSNFIVLDVKGELMYKYGLYLQSKGYTLRCLNLKDQQLSDRYNPFAYIETEVDLIKLIENIYDSIDPDPATSQDPFWVEGPKLYMQSVFYYEWFMAKKEGRTGTMNNILTLINEEMMADKTVKVAKGQKPPSLLEKRMNELAKEYGADNPAVRDYRKFKSGAAETVRSIIIIVNAKLKLCETAGLKRIFEDDDMNLREFATGIGGTVEHPTDKKMALFLCINDNDQSFNFICSMLYSQAIEILSRMADTDFRDRGGSLPIPLEMWLDEFYAGARPHDTEKLMGVVRSRNISLIPILQSVAQIKVCFDADKWEVIMDNCPVMIFLGAGAGATETHKYISDLLGKMTIDTLGDGRNGQNYSSNFSRQGRELMTPSEVKRMDRKCAIVFMEEERPVYDRKALPWEDRSKSSPFKSAMKLNDSAPDKGYIHPVAAYEDPKTGEMMTLQGKEQPPVHVLTEEEKEALPKDTQIVKYTDEEFLKANLKKPQTSAEAVRDMMMLFAQMRG